MTEKQTFVRLRREDIRASSMRHKAVVLVSMIVCHSYSIDAFCIHRYHHRHPDCLTTQSFFCEPVSPVSSSLSRPGKGFALQGVFGGLFGGGDDETDRENAVLATHDIGDFDGKDLTVRFESISDFITNKWSALFVSGEISLTTPVSLTKSANTIDENGNSDTETIEDSVSCRLIFQKVDSGFKSKEEEKASEDGSASSEKQEASQGGIEISVQKISKTESPDDSERSLRVLARRCEIDEDTLIKEMSEEIIVKELQKAISIWKKDTA